MKDFFRNFFNSPLKIVATVFLTALTLVFVYTPEKPDKITEIRLKALQNRSQATNSVNSLQTDSAEQNVQTIGDNSVDNDNTGDVPVTTAKIVVYSVTGEAESTTQTELTEVSTSTATTITTCEPHEYYYDYISAGESPNSSYYQDRLAIIGDSIAYGYNAYGYIPYEHNIARESLAIWNMDTYSFDIDGYYAGWLDTADYVNAPLYFISIGINDIYSCTPDEYGASILNIAQQVLERVPTATIIVGDITPIAYWNTYTTNENIRSFNYSLQTAVENANNPQILFFDTYSVLADPNTLALSDSYSSGDGMHLSGDVYSYILNAMFNFLDSADVMKQIEIHDTTAY